MWGKPQSSSKYARAHARANTRFGPARSGDSGLRTHRPAEERARPLATAGARRPVPHRRKEILRGGARGTWRFYTFWGPRLPRPPLPLRGLFFSSSLASSAFPGKVDRAAGEGGRAPPQLRLPPARDRSGGPRRDPAAARPWVSSSGPAWHSAALSPAVPRLGRSRGRERRQRGTSSSLEEQAAQSDPEADDRGPEVTPQGASRGGAGRRGAGSCGVGLGAILWVCRTLRRWNPVVLSFSGGCPAGNHLWSCERSAAGERRNLVRKHARASPSVFTVGLTSASHVPYSHFSSSRGEATATPPCFTFENSSLGQEFWKTDLLKPFQGTVLMGCPKILQSRNF